MEEKEKRVLANTLERSLEKSPEKDAGRELLRRSIGVCPRRHARSDGIAPRRGYAYG